MEEIKSISLTKGAKVDLGKEAPGLQNAVLGLGWDTNQSGGAAFDLDASVFMLNKDGKLGAGNEKRFVYFKNLESPCKSVVHSGDNLTGEGDGDDEVVNVDLNLLPTDVEELQLIVNIYDAVNRKQNFGQVKNAFIRLFDPITKNEILRYDLSEDFSTETAVVFGRLYRHNGVVKFEATGTGEKAGLDTYLAKFNS